MTEERFSSAAAQAWEDLVRLAANTDDVDGTAAKVAGWTKTDPKTVKVKILAIRSEILRGSSADQVIEMGQSECLSRQAKARKAAKAGDPDRVLSFRMPRSLADAWQNPYASKDQVEPVITRLNRVCQLESSEDLFDFLKSLLDDFTDQDLADHAGVEPPEKKRKRR